MSGPVTITHIPRWRSKRWDPDIPSREAWLVICTEHDWVGKDSDGEQWGYAERRRASSVFTKHGRSHHGWA